jgi:aminobenzoyl-glutamate utilization protein B
VREDPALKAFSQEKTAGGTLPLNNFVMPYTPSCQMSPGSTDVGDVSWLTPTAQFTAVTWVSGSPGHSWQNVATGKHSIAHKGLLLAAKVLAGTAADLMEQPDILAQARKEFDIATAAGYDCPLNEN